MPKNVIISEGGKGLRFADVSKLITDKSNGNDSWVPTEDRIIRQKYISKNGVYYAKDDGIYGFSKLTVNIPGGAQGYTVPTVASLPYGVETITTDPSQPMPIIPGTVGSSVMGLDPDTGYVSIATVNPKGEVEIKAIPQAIAVTKMPNKLSYTEGDEIDYTGIEVNLYVKYEETSSGGSTHIDAIPYKDERYPDGKIPFEELIFPKKTAKGDGGYASDVDTSPIQKPIQVAGIVSYYSWTNNVHRMATTTVTPDDGSVLLLAYTTTGAWKIRVYAASENSTPKATIIRHSNHSGQTWEEAMSGASSAGARITSETFHGKTVYIREVAFSALSNGLVAEERAALLSGTYLLPQGSWNSWDVDEAAWVAIYGDGASSIVPVQWKSPYDDKTYETSFKIDVVKKNEESGGGSSEGGSSEGGGGGGHSF